MEIKTFPSSLRDAVKSASKYYFTGKPCPKGHVSKRFTLNSSCYKCYLENQNKKRKIIKKIFNATEKAKQDLKNTPHVAPDVTPDDVPSNAPCYTPSNGAYSEALDAVFSPLTPQQQANIAQDQPRNRSDWMVCPGKPHKKIKITEEIREIFEYWCFVMGKTNKTVLDYDRASAIKQGLDMTDKVHLKLAIDGCKLDEWHMGGNDRKTVYNEPIHIFKSMAKIEKFIELTKPKLFELKLNANGLIAVEDLRTAYNNGLFSSD